ncbi:cyclin-dependent kinase C_1 [Striga asiatica]|uniref:Cyclin-dependent kinase C_1 n=1 Tax=Striga asiatica TaxID=4170 RepID=A0A5A7RE54_STRAF|nr:cyclin-dependent kinase C_1 [Striga asiatica]
MAMVVPEQLNVTEVPVWGSRSVDCFEKLEQIGEGTYGQVYMAREIKTGEIVALKKIRMDNEREGFPITAIREIKILKKLHHENVIKLKEIVTSTGPEKDEQGASDGNKYRGGIYMVFEYMDHDLTGLADRPGMRFSVPQIKCYMRQLLTGLHYCHVNQVLHRDIKGSNLLIDNEGNLKLADFGLARSFSSDQNANLTNRVITLWYRPPELLLGTTKYGPAVDMWSVGCIFAELLNGKPVFPGKDEPEQLNKIFDICGTPNEDIWPGVSKIPWYNNFKPTRLVKRRLREHFRHFDRHALDLLDRMLTLDPSQQRQHEENTKRQKLQHQQHHSRVPPIQQSGHGHAHLRPGPNHPPHGSQPQVAGVPTHHYGKPRGPSAGPGRYPPGGNNTSGGYNHPNRGQGGSGYGNGPSGPYPPQGRAPPYGSSGMPGAVPRGGPNYPHGGPYGSSGGGRGSNMGNRNQQYNWQQ